MIKIVLCLALHTIPVSDKTITSKTDSLGYTRYSGPGITGTAKTDSLGYTRSEWNDHGKRSSCVSKTDSLGYTRTACH